MSGAAPRISVVVPTRRRPALLCRCLKALLAQTLPAQAFEIVVVDDGHEDDTRRVVQAMRRAGGPTLTYLRPRDGRGAAVARNTGWRAATGVLIAFTDDDTIADPQWLEQGEAALRDHPRWAAAGGAVRVPPLRHGRAPSDHEITTRGLERTEFVTANAFVRRSALLRVGGFDERFLMAWREDSDLQFRLMREAGPVGRAEGAVVCHPVRPERWGVSLRQQRNAFFDALLYREHPQLYRERICAAPPWDYYATVMLTLAGLALGRWHPALALSALAAAALLTLRLALRRLRAADRSLAHVAEMLATSALIPFFAIYWRLRGALHFRVWFL